MKKTFRTKITLKEYLNYYAKTMGPLSILIMVGVSGKLFFGDHTYKHEFILGLLFGYPMLFIAAVYYNYISKVRLIFTFAPEGITISSGSKTVEYQLSDIEEISLPKKKDHQNTMRDYINIKFRDGKTYRFNIVLPYFFSLKKFLVQFLIENNVSYLMRYK